MVKEKKIKEFKTTKLFIRYVIQIKSYIQESEVRICISDNHKTTFIIIFNVLCISQILNNIMIAV